MSFFVAVAVAVAQVESYLVHQGYFAGEGRYEQTVLRLADEVLEYAHMYCPSAAPSMSFGELRAATLWSRP